MEFEFVQLDKNVTDLIKGKSYDEVAAIIVDLTKNSFPGLGWCRLGEGRHQFTYGENNVDFPSSTLNFNFFRWDVIARALESLEQNESKSF